MLYRQNNKFDPFKENFVSDNDIEGLALPRQLIEAFDLSARQLEERAKAPQHMQIVSDDAVRGPAAYVPPKIAAVAAQMFRDNADALRADDKTSEELFRRTMASLVILEKRHVHDAGWEIEGELFPPLLFLRASLKAVQAVPEAAQLQAA